MTLSGDKTNATIMIVGSAPAHGRTGTSKPWSEYNCPLYSPMRSDCGCLRLRIFKLRPYTNMLMAFLDGDDSLAH